MILIFSTYNDFHTKAIVQKLEKFGITPYVIDISLLTRFMFAEVDYNLENTKFEIENRHKHIDLSTIRSVWWRRPQPPAINPEIFNPEYIKFAYNEWTTILMGLWQCNRDKLWINDLTYDAAAANKIYQLHTAKKIGLPMPKTLITNKPDSAVSFWKENNGRLIFKSFLATRQQWRETRPLRQEYLKYINNLKYVPCIFQEYVGNSYDVRITVIGETIFAGKTRPSSFYEFDWRMTQPHFKEHQLSDDIKKLILDLMFKLKLEFGAIDMKLTEDGRYYFLEINPAGQYLFLENDTKLPISNTLAKHLLSGKKTRT